MSYRHTAYLCPDKDFRDFLKEFTTGIADMFKLLLSSTHIKLEVKNGTFEQPFQLYLRMCQFIRDNLLPSCGKIRHDGKGISPIKG